jgi:hypothetical protein
MRYFQETTKWSVTAPNHIYLLSTDKTRLFAYIKAGSNEPVVLSKPMTFFAKDRTFVDAGKY